MSLLNLAGGSKTYRFTADISRDPVTNRRRQRTFTYRRLKDAKAELARIGHEVSTGKYVQPFGGPLNQLLDDYLRSAAFEKEENTKLSYRNALRLPRERLGERKAASITRQDIEDLRAYALTSGRKLGGTPGSGLGSRSTRLMLGRLSAAFDQACKDGRLARNPCQYVDLPKQVRAERGTWSEEEANRWLATAATDRLHGAWRLSALGERRSEVLGERWDDFEADAGTITVARARVLVGGKTIEKSPKSVRGTRTLPLDTATVAALKALRKRQLEERMAAGVAYEDSGYIAADELGRPLSPERLSDEFKKLCRVAGVPVVRLHDARHSINSMLAKRGVPPHIRALWLGHTSEVNQTTYTHASAADLAMVTSAIGEIFRAV